MLRLVADENLHRGIVRGLLTLRPALDLVRVQDVGLLSMDDEAILAWAALEDRIVVTHDRSTMTDFADIRLSAGEAMPGMFVFHSRCPVRAAIRAIALINQCSEHSEWNGQVEYLPW